MFKPKKSTIKQIKDIADSYNVDLKFIRSGGSACTHNTLIEIDLSECNSLDTFLSLFFHELGHVYCYNKNLYEFYHKENDNRDKYSYMKKYGLRAERFVDRLGETLMKLYYPNNKFHKNYDTQEDVKDYYKWCEETYASKKMRCS